MIRETCDNRAVSEVSGWKERVSFFFLFGDRVAREVGSGAHVSESWLGLHRVRFHMALSRCFARFLSDPWFSDHKMAEIKSKKKAARGDSGSGQPKKHKPEAKDDAAAPKDEDVTLNALESPQEDAFELSMLDCLVALSSYDREMRMQAASSLIAQLKREQGDGEEPCEDLALVVERVTYGLASGREGSRQGFSVALAEILHAFPRQTILSKVLAIAEEKMDATGEKGDVEKQIYFGKIFVVACVMRSGRLSTVEGAERDAVLAKCFEILVAMFEKKSYMKELVAHTLVELLHSLKSDREVREIALPALDALLKLSPEDCSPESLALLLSLKEDAHKFNSEWKKGVPLLVQSELIKPALLASSYAHPRTHFVWKIVLDGAFAAGGEVVKSVWTLIDSALFGSHVDNRKYLAFSLLIEFVQRARTVEEVLFCLSSTNTTRALVNHLASNRVTKMSDVATRALEQIKNQVTASQPLGLALLEARYLAPINLDLQLVPVLTAESGFRYLDNLLAGFNKEQGERLVSAVKRGWKKWSGDDKVKGNAALATRATEMARLFAKLAFLSDVEADRPWGKMRLMTVLTEFESTGHANLLELCQWLVPQLGDRVEGKAVKLLNKAFRLSAPNNRYEQAFGKVLGLVSFENLEQNEESEANLMELWEDAIVSYSKFCSAVQKGDFKERNKAVLVLVSLMLELLTAPSALNRVIVVNAFRLLAPMIPEYGIRDIVMAIVSTDNEDAKEGDEEGQEDDEEDHDHDDDDDDEDDGQHLDNHRGEGADQDIMAGDYLPDIPLDEADPEYLKRVEESLGNIFRAMKEKKANSSTKKATAALDFKLRVVDLLENFAHGVSRMASMDVLPLASRVEGDNRSVIFTVLPLLLGKLKKTQYSAALKPLNDKLSRVVLKEICDMREWPSMAGHARVLLKALKSVLAFATRGNPSQELVALIQGSAAILTKVLAKERLLPAAVAREEYVKVAHFVCTHKNLKFLTMERFLSPLWKRIPETAVTLFPLIAEASGSKEWTQHARLSTLMGLIDFVLRSGKSYLLQDPSQVVACVQSVERAFLAWLRYENGHTKSQTVANLVTQVRSVFVDVLCEPRLGAMEKSQLYNSLPLRNEVAESLNAVVGKYQHASKLATQAEKLIKLFHL